jgi:hypothetical protein
MRFVLIAMPLIIKVKSQENVGMIANALVHMYVTKDNAKIAMPLTTRVTT